jgi:hypothetical protein
MRQKHTLDWPNSLKVGVFIFVSVVILILLVVLKLAGGS